MKAKKIVVMVCLALCLVAFFCVNGDAADGWYTCTIARIGSNTLGSSVKIYVMLTASNGAFTAKYFAIPEDQYKTTLAVMLTAMSSGMQVMVKVDPTIVDYHVSYVKDLYLLGL